MGQKKIQTIFLYTTQFKFLVFKLRSLKSVNNILHINFSLDFDFLFPKIIINLLKSDMVKVITDFSSSNHKLKVKLANSC